MDIEVLSGQDNEYMKIFTNQINSTEPFSLETVGKLFTIAENVQKTMDASFKALFAGKFSLVSFLKLFH